MANRYGLGSADFQIVVNNQQALQAFAQTEVKAREGSRKIAAAIAEVEGGTKSLSSGFGSAAVAGVAFGAALLGIQASAIAVSEAIKSIQEETLKAKQAQFELIQTFKGASAEYTRFAAQLAEQTNRTTSEVQASIVAFGVLQQNYALTSGQIKTLTTLTAAYSAKSGRDLEQSARDIQAAIRGEGEAVEKLGLTLGRDFVRNTQEMTEAQRKNFFTISDLERAQIILNAAQKQGAEFQSAIGDRAKSDLGVYDQWNTAVKNLQQSIGEGLNPALQATLPYLISWTNAISLSIKDLTQGDGLDVLREFALIIALSGVNSSKAASAVLEFIQRTRDLKAAQAALRDPFPGEAGFIGPTLKEAQDNEAIQKQVTESIKSQLQQQTKDTIEANKEKSESIRRAIDFEIDEHNKSYEVIRANTERQKNARIQAAEDAKKAQIEGIKEEEEAFKEQHEDTIARLRERRDEEKRTASDTRDDTIAAIEVEKDAVEASAKETIRQLEIERDAKLDQIEDVRDTALEAIEEEKTAQIDLIDNNIALAQQEKEQLGRVAEDIKERTQRELEDEQKERARYFEDRIRQADELKEHELNNAEEEKEGKLRQLEREQERRQDIRKQEDRNIEDLERARERARQAQDETFDREKEAVERRRDLQDRALDHEQDNLKHRRELQTRALDEQLEDELEAIDQRDKAIEKSYDNEADIARRTTDQILDQLDRQKDQNEELHRQAIYNIDSEKRARIDEIEDRLRAADEISRSFGNQNKLQDLGLDLTVATNKGDLTEVRRIEEEIRRERLRQTYESVREGLKVQKDSVADELDAKKAALQEEYRQRQDALDQEKQQIKDSLQASLDAIKSRSDQLKVSYESEKALIRERFETIKQSLADQRFAEDQQLQERLERLADQRLAEDEQFEANLRRIEAQRQVEDDASAANLRRIEDIREKEDRQLDHRKERIEDSYEREREEIEETHDRTVSKLKDEQEETKRSFDARKRIIEDTYEDEKSRLQDLYDDPVNGILARLRNQRETTQREYAAKAEIVRQTYEEEKENIQDTYNGEAAGLIPTIKRAVEAQRVEYDRRKKVAEDTYNDEQHRIDELYDNPVSGLIAQQQKMARVAETEYSKRRAAVQATYDAEILNIHNVFDGPDGLIAKQAKAHKDVIDNLNGQKTAWQNWENDTRRNIQNILDGPLKAFVDKIKELEERGFITPGSVETREQAEQRIRRGGGPGPSVGAGLPYNVLFPFDAPYNGPYGGALWPGGPTRHRGIDLTLPGANSGRGSPIGAFSDARVVSLPSEPNGGDGIITQRKADGLFEYYGHLDSRSVDRGQEIRRGQNIGTLGASGLEPWNTPHLHYEVRRNGNGDPVGQTIDPRPYMAGLQNTLSGGFNPEGGDVLELRPFGPNGAVVVIRATAQDWYSKARQIGREEDFSDPDLFARQMQHESGGFDPEVISGRHIHGNPRIIGIAQFNEQTARALGVNPFNPIESLHGAARYMRQLERRYAGYRGHTGQYNALWAYNAGEGNLQSGEMFGETRRYLDILLPGHAAGKMIMEPTLMIGMKTGEMGIAGETGQPERLLGVSDTASYGNNGGPMQMIHLPVIIGGDTIVDLIITGHRLMAKNGRGLGVPGIVQE